MKWLLFIPLLLFAASASAQTRYEVASGVEFNAVQNEASEGDTIVWQAGTYLDTRIEIDKSGLVVIAESSGTVLFTGVSRAVINGSNVTFSGFQFIGGFIGALDVIRVFGSDVLISEINIQNYTCFKYLVVDEDSRRTTIRHCNFENRLNLDDKNILSILVDNEPGYHKIQYCSFKNFDGTGNDLGIEPIRIGVSSTSTRDSRTLVEYCYFTQCNGDGEIISHKARQNVYRYNTFENNPVAELVLRHGDEGVVYGNFFLNNMGGIRVREGSDHFIYNNYFEGLTRRSIFLQNESSDPLSNIHIYHNTIVNSEEARLGGPGSNPPTNVVFANNVFTNPVEQLFDEETDDENWLGNLYFGTLGIDAPSTGLSNVDPELVQNIEGFFQPITTSPVVAAAVDGYPAIPLFPGMDYDNDLSLDLMQQPRPPSVADRTVGASEYSPTVDVQPYVNEFNTGPSYLFDNLVDYLTTNTSQFIVEEVGENRSFFVSSNTDWAVTTNVDWITVDAATQSGNARFDFSVSANPEIINRSGDITVSNGVDSVMMRVFQDAGPVSVLDRVIDELVLYPNPSDGEIRIKNLPAVIRQFSVEITDLSGKIILEKPRQVNTGDLLIDVSGISPGVYFLYFITLQGHTTVQTRKVIIN